MCSRFIRRYVTIAGRTAFVLAVAFVACSSSVKAQAIEEGGFPAKGVDNYSEPFSLSCPSRLYVRAGESLPLSCVATGVPEEGIRYEWASVSGEGFRHLSAPDELSPFFTALVSGTSSEYAYRLTATGAGVYATASMTVTVEGVPGRSSGLPGLHKECDPLTVPEGFGAGCSEDRGPVPFGFGPEEEFPFSDAPGLSDRPSGPVREGAFDRLSPPRLECPAAVFLEELETGAIACHASGEEYLEYAWEPVGSTTRDYLDNPRLFPEDSPTPSVIAPETPAYETLESFQAGETTLRYRYRLTATSRATDLSSFSEVEVFVSSSRPGVYCPSEIEVAEGETVSLDCEGVDPLSFRMGYDEEAASVLWEWEGLWGASTANLAETHLSSPLFTAPPGSAGKEYHYIASMTTSASGAPRTARRKVAVKVAVGGAEEDTEAHQSAPLFGISCSGTSFTRYAGSDNIRVNCTASAPWPTNTFRWLWKTWSADDLPQTVSCCGGLVWPIPDRLSIVLVTNMVFSMPSAVADTTIYKYTVGVWRVTDEIGTLYDSEDITVTVLPKKPRIAVTCEDPGSAYEGDDDIELECEPSGAPGDEPQYAYAWTARGDTEDTALLSALNIASPTFYVPDEVDENETYKYLLTVSAENARNGSAKVTVTVIDTDPSIACTPEEVFEGAADITLSCTVQNEPLDASYSWTALEGTPDTNLLTSGTDTPTPTFSVPDNVDTNTDYDYRLALSVDGTELATGDVTVTVKDLPDITVTCADNSYEVDEGDDDIELECEPSGAPGDEPDYMWSWSPEDKLTDADTSTPTFDVPDNVSQDTTYTYTATVSAANAEDGSATVRVTVLDLPPSIECNDLEVYEGASDSTLDCSVENEPSDATYSWTGTDVDNWLSSTTTLTPTFYVPDDIDEPGDADKTYEYTVTLSASGVDDVTENVTVTVLERPDITVTCATPAPVYEGAENFALDCSASGAPAGSTINYAWTGLGDTVVPGQLSATDGPSPTFDAPDNVDANTDYEYRLTVTAENADAGSTDVTVTVLNKKPLTVTCAPPAPVYEGAADFALDCSALGAPAGSTINYEWTGRGDTVVPGQLSATDSPSPTFDVPDNVDANTDYEYRLTASAENAEDTRVEVTVTVLNKKPLDVTCATPSPVYEGSEDFDLDCAASGAPAGSAIAYAWAPHGDTQDTALLIAGTDGPSPTFDVPETVEEDETHKYLLTVSAENAENATASVTVKVLTLETVALVCASPPLVYEGSEDFALDCSISGDTGDTDYAYTWTVEGDAGDTSLLSALDIASPTFHVPEELDATATYKYLLTARAENTEDATVQIVVTVLNKGALAVACSPVPLTYEGSADFVLDCEASGAPSGSDYDYVWEARGDTPDVSLLSATDVASPTFLVPDDIAATTTYEYLLTVSAENADPGTAEVAVTILNKGALAVVCTDPGSVYEGSADFALDCEASGAPSSSAYDYTWTARGATPDVSLLSATDIASPTFHVPEAVAGTTRYEYLLTVSAENAEAGSATVRVTVLDKPALAVVCSDPGSVYEGSNDILFDCEASGAPAGSGYDYAWTARGSTQGTSLLSATDIASPTFHVPEEVAATTRYEYLLTVSARNAETARAEVSVTVLNTGALLAACADPGSVYEGSPDIAFGCEASGAPAGSAYEYSWTARGATQDVLLLSATDVASPTFHVPEDVAVTTTYEYLLTVSAENAEGATAEVTVTVLDKPALAVVCADPGSVYEGSDDITFDCAASGAPDGFAYDYVWEARGNTSDTSLLSATNIASPTFHVPDNVDETTTYDYLLTVSAENAVDATAEVSVTVLDKPALAVVCADPGSVYEGAADVAFDCAASGAPQGSSYEYAWTARGDTEDTSLLNATDIASPTFHVPEEVPATTTYEYLLTVRAGNAEDGSTSVTVTVLNKGALLVTCADPGSVYEGAADVAFDCAASGAPQGSSYEYSWTARGDTEDTSLLSATDIASPTFHVPEEVPATTTYEYLLTVSAENAEGATAEVAVTVLDRVVTPDPDPEPVTPPVASSTDRSSFDPFALGLTVSASPLRFGVQSADTEVSLDPVTDGVSTYISGPYHAGRMTLAAGGSEALDENGEMDMSIELLSPVVLKREGGVEESSLALTPRWSYAESCEQLSSQTLGGLYTELTLSETDCRLLRFGGELDLTGVSSGYYAGTMDILVRSGENEETHSVEVVVTVVPAQRVITIGPGGVRFDTSRKLPAGLTEEQNLSIYPDVAFLTERNPDGVFELSNPSLIPLEVSVSARFGYTEATENGREVVVEDVEDSDLGDLSEVVDIHPGVLILQPGEKGLIRYGVKAEAHKAMSEQGYAAFFDVVSAPRRYADLDRMPEEVTDDRTARVTMRVSGVYISGEGASQLRATLLSVSYVGSLSATFLLETPDRPFAGEVAAYDEEGRELGRRETLIYTRSRVRIPLDRMPEKGSVFLRFTPRGSGRAPLPATVDWNAPRRDIGALGNP